MQIYFLSGCEYHCHKPEDCGIRKKSATHNFLGRRNEEVALEFEAKKRSLEREVPGITISVTWECEFKAKMKTKEAEEFHNSFFIDRGKDRLAPRQA